MTDKICLYACYLDKLTLNYYHVARQYRCPYMMTIIFSPLFSFWLRKIHLLDIFWKIGNQYRNIAILSDESSTINSIHQVFYFWSSMRKLFYLRIIEGLCYGACLYIYHLRFSCRWNCNLIKISFNLKVFYLYYINIIRGLRTSLYSFCILNSKNKVYCTCVKIELIG